jgi:cytochrome c biogenesis protein CcdA
LVIAGLVCSFSLATLPGSAPLTALHLPQDAIRWAALLVLTLIGLGLIFPPLQHLIERPFAYLPQHQINASTDGFGLGLTLGALYVPCAGPVLAAIVVAGKTSQIGPGALVLTATFALGNALPLLAFATTLHTSWRSSIGITSPAYAYCLTCGAPVRQLSHALRVTQLRQ